MDIVTKIRLSINNVALVLVTADCSSQILKVEQLGSQNSYMNDSRIKKGNTMNMKSTDRLFLLKGQYKYKVKFTVKDNTKKRSHGDDIECNAKRKKVNWVNFCMKSL